MGFERDYFPALLLFVWQSSCLLPFPYCFFRISSDVISAPKSDDNPKPPTPPQKKKIPKGPQAHLPHGSVLVCILAYKELVVFVPPSQRYVSLIDCGSPNRVRD